MGLYPLPSLSSMEIFFIRMSMVLLMQPLLHQEKECLELMLVTPMEQHDLHNCHRAPLRWCRLQQEYQTPSLVILLDYKIWVIGLPQMALAMGEMDSDWRQANSPRTVMVIDDKGEKNVD